MKSFVTVIVLPLFAVAFLVGCEEIASHDKQLTLVEYKTLGEPDAPVLFVEFSDYQCPFCKKFTSETLPKIKQDYIDTGKVRFVFKDFPLEIHEHARQTAVAARCAGEQGKYFEYHDLLFADSSSLSREGLLAMAENADLNTADFERCLDDPAIIADIENDVAEAKSRGISGTPSFLINGQLVTGAQPYGVFKEIIDAKLARREAKLGEVSTGACGSQPSCGDSKTLGPYCSHSETAESCTTTASPECSGGECVTVISEKCTACPEGTDCVKGNCS